MYKVDKEQICFICKREATIESFDPLDALMRVECSKCGTFNIDSSAAFGLENGLRAIELNVTKLTHYIARFSQDLDNLTITAEKLNNIIDKYSLPKPFQQSEYLIEYLGKHITFPQDKLWIDIERIISIIGANKNEGLHYIVQHLNKDGIIDCSQLSSETGNFKDRENVYLGLTYDGWKLFDSLFGNSSSNKLAFMAMQFQDSKFTNNIYYRLTSKVFEETGFKLRILPEAEQPMGLIDDHLRFEIKRSRFLVAEITEHNSNVLWEAGYAEGLNKKVVYLCQEDSFRDSKRKKAFDIEHQLTIPWSEEKLDISINKLIDTIRNTFNDAKSSKELD